MRMFFLWLKSVVVDFFNRVFNPKSLNVQLKACPSCGHYPIVTVLHQCIEVKCPNHCCSISVPNTNKDTDFAELIWQWNKLIENKHYHGSGKAPDTPKQHNSSQTYGFGQYFIEHPNSEVAPDGKDVD